ncbi:MAG: hypothetical protein J3R72DRAFT_426183 [Linnemannia gamsii]|nr:MAG: hypothetical protein J3R72DRAFT_426183 [Linnemannia gamsii]
MCENGERDKSDLNNGVPFCSSDADDGDKVVDEGWFFVSTGCPKSSTEAAGPGDDFEECVEFMTRVVAELEANPRGFCSEGGRPLALASGVAGIGESGTWMVGSCGQLEQKKRRGRAASWIERIAAASLVILGACLQDRQSLLVHVGSWQPMIALPEPAGLAHSRFDSVPVNLTSFWRVLGRQGLTGPMGFAVLSGPARSEFFGGAEALGCPDCEEGMCTGVCACVCWWNMVVVLLLVVGLSIVAMIRSEVRMSEVLVKEAWRRSVDSNDLEVDVRNAGDEEEEGMNPPVVVSCGEAV